MLVSVRVVALVSLLGAETVLAGPLTGQTLAVNSSQSGFTPASALVGPSFEFQYPNASLNFDFSVDGLLDISFVRGGGSHAFAGSNAFVSFFDLNGTIDEIIGFTLLGVDSGISGVNQSDLSVTANSVRFNLGNTVWGGVNTTASFRIYFVDRVVPEPTILTIFGLGLAALGYSRRLKKVKKGTGRDRGTQPFLEGNGKWVRFPTGQFSHRSIPPPNRNGP